MTHRDMSLAEKGTNFRIQHPRAAPRPLILSSPHSGQIYPQEFLEASRLDALQIRSSEDFLVDSIFQAAPACGAALIDAQIARAFLDLNREPYELDPKMFEERLPAHVNIASVGVSVGLGTIARVVANNMEIYKGLLSYDEAHKRIASLYFPYHHALNALISETRQRFGHVILIDCHSMPSAQSGPDGADFIIGNRYGTSAASELSHKIRDILQAMNYRVTFNRPYSGGFITKHYGRPHAGFHALQIEINRALYMNEAAMKTSEGFAPLQNHMRRLLEEIAALPNNFANDFLRSKETTDALYCSPPQPI